MSINNIQDYYYILGLAKSASKGEIKIAYRKLSLKFHPDQNNGDKFFEERFRDVNEAYGTLINDAKRKWYDDKVDAINDASTHENKYYPINAAQGRQSKRPREHDQADTPRPNRYPLTATRKQKSNRALYIIITAVLFVSPFVIKIVIDTFKSIKSKNNYASILYPSSQNLSRDTATALITKKAGITSSNVPPIVVLVAPTDTTSSSATAQNNMSRQSDFKDEDGLTATSALKYFLQALSNNDCNAAWSMAYNETWQNNGQDWFCSSQAFGGVRKVLIHNMYPVMRDYAEVEMHVDYYAEDIYNGNKCFKQNITLREIAFTDKTRWKVTNMRNVEEPVECDGH